MDAFTKGLEKRVTQAEFRTSQMQRVLVAIIEYSACMEPNISRDFMLPDGSLDAEALIQEIMR